MISGIATGLLLASAGVARADTHVVYGGSQGLTVIGLDGQHPRPLGVEGRGATWSPDGERIAYTDATGVWVVRSAGGRASRVAVDSQAWSLAWSPDGQYLAYDRPRSERSGIVVVSLFDDGYTYGEPREVTRPLAGMVDLDPAWSPDGSTIAFRRHDLRTNYYDLMVQEIPSDYPNGSYRATVLLDQGFIAPFSAPSWAPDGAHLAFVGIPRTGETAGYSHLYRIARDGSGLELLVGGATWTPGSPVYSPEGTRIAYTRLCWAECAEAKGDDGSGVWVLDLASGGTTPIADTAGFEESLSWSADGFAVVFEAVYADSGCHCSLGEPYVTAADGSELRRLDELFHQVVEPDTSPDVTHRAAGVTRIETAVAISRAAFDRAEAVVLARSDTYADALAGAALAGSLGGPVLLTPRDALPLRVELEIRRLGASHVILLGDESALSSAVEAQVTTLVDSVERIGGDTRYETASLIAGRLLADHAFVVQGISADPSRGWPDAVAVAGLAGALGEPLLLVDQAALPAATAEALEAGGYQRVTVVGGTAAVSEEVAQDIRALGIVVERLEGATRYATSAVVAQRAVASGLDPGRVWLATGRDWPDSLAAGPAAASAGGLLLLVDGADLAASPEVRNLLVERPPDRAWIAGGPDVVTPGVRVAVERL